MAQPTDVLFGFSIPRFLEMPVRALQNWLELPKWKKAMPGGETALARICA